MPEPRKQDRSTWVIGGTTMMGLGVGFIFLSISPFIMVASLLIGIGLGLVIVPFLSRARETQ